MNNPRGIAVILVLVVAVGVFSFKLGQQGSNDGAKEPQSVAQTTQAQIAEPQTNQAPTSPSATSGGIVKAQLMEGGGKLNTAAERIAHFDIGSRNVKSILPDGELIWLATSGGVIRYNSSSDNYKVFDNKTPGVLSNGIFHVGKMNDLLLVGSYGGGLSVLDTKTEQWRNYNIPNGLADQFVYDTAVTTSGDLWIATWSGANLVKGGKLDDKESWQTFTVENTQGGLPNPWVYAIKEGVNGEMWFATEAGLARYKDGKWENWQHKNGLGAPFEVVKDAIQFTNDPARASKHHAQQKAEQGLEDINVAYNPNYIISLAVDKDGTVWCGTWGGGLAKFDGKQWRNFTTQDGLPGNHIFMLHRTEQGELWVGTSKGLSNLNRQDDTFTTLTVNDGLFANNVFSMARAMDGSVWVGSFGGVARIAGNQWAGK